MSRRLGASHKRRVRHWRRLRPCVLCGAAALAGGLIPSSQAVAQQQNYYTRDTFGEVGLLDIPSGHMAEDGELAFSMGDVKLSQRYTLAFQALPWVEATFRYSHIVGQFSGFDEKHFYDRSFGVKFRLWREGDLAPDISVGIRDILGTGVYGAEYIVASKVVGPFDLTAGLGWGRLGEGAELPNPLGLLRSSFNVRTFSNSTGQFNYRIFFHGPRTGVFGGLAWQTPLDGLKVLAEYSSDRYSEEVDTSGVHERTPVNVGLSYSPSSAVALSAGWYYGTTYGFTLTFQGGSATEAPSTMRIGPPVPPVVVRDGDAQQRALSSMMDQNNRLALKRSGGPWIQVPTEAEHTKQVLMQALLSQSSGVRDIDIQGATLVVDARSQNDAQRQCAKYAEIATSLGTHTTSIAMTDLQSSNGSVTFCPVAILAAYGQDASPDRPVSDSVVSKNQAQLTDQLRIDLNNQAVILSALSLGTNELWLYYENYRYGKESEAIGRITRVLMAQAPPSIEQFHLISTRRGVPQQEVTIARGGFERVMEDRGAYSGLAQAVSISTPPLDNPALDNVTGFYPRISWSLDPKLAEHIFDPDMPLQFMVYADAAAIVDLAPGLLIGTELTGNLWNNYLFGRGAGSYLPHVRTDLLQYIKDGKYGISNLQIIYQTRLTRDIVAEFKAGYLEDMFMGAGGNILWRPENSRFTFGADLYQVWKRDFNRLFGIQNYHVLTGHASVYYRSPWYDVNFALHVGRYLARDRGVTFEMTRTFDTGIEIGAFATLTNVPFSTFGEGSFDKGLIIHIPFEWGLPVFSQSAYDLRLNSLTRDGGQRLAGDDSLYEETRRTSYGEIDKHFDALVEP